MDKISEPELTKRIDTFMARKMQQYPSLQKTRRRVPGTARVRTEAYKPSFLEKLNDLWVQRVHA